MTKTTSRPTEAKLREIARRGLALLPASFASQPYYTEHAIQALIYEFEKGGRDGDARLIPPEGRLGAVFHLKKANLVADDMHPGGQ